MSEKDTLDMKLLWTNNNNLQPETTNSFKNNLWRNNFINLAWFETLIMNKQHNQNLKSWKNSSGKSVRFVGAKGIPFLHPIHRTIIKTGEQYMKCEKNAAL